MSIENNVTDNSLEATPELDLTIDIQVVSSCERRIKVTVPRSDIERYYQNEYADLEKSAYVPGFRVGKAPRKLVEKRFKKDVADRVKNVLVIDTLSQVNNSPDLTPISEPDFDYDSLVLPDEGSFVFEFAIEVRPEFDLPEWKGLKIEKPVREFSPEDVDRAVDRVLSTYGKQEPIDTPAEPGNFVVANITIKDGDTVLTKSDENLLCLRKKLSFHDGAIENFDKLMAGTKVGDTVSVQMKLTDDAANADYRGKTVEAVFEVSEVRKNVPPAMSESFLDRLGGFENVADFRDAVLDSLKRQLEHEQRRRARATITKSLTVSATWELPPGLLARQSEREFRRTIMELQRSGYGEEEIIAHVNFLRQNSAVETARALKEHFILERIAEVENIEDTEADYDLEIALIAAHSGDSPRRVRARIEKNGEMDILRNQIIERKVIDLISQNAEFSEVPFEFEDADEEAVDWPAAGDPDSIAEATEEDLKAVGREMDEKRKINPNAKIK